MGEGSEGYQEADAVGGDMVEWACPDCRSKRLIKYGWKYRRNKNRGRKIVRQQRRYCKNCGRVTVKPVRVRRA